MTIGFNLIVMGGAPFYTPAFRRSGEQATFAIQALGIAGTPALAVDIEHKNYEDVAWTVAGSFTSISAVGLSYKDVSSIKEMLRIKFTPTGTDGEAFNLYIPDPAWRPY